MPHLENTPPKDEAPPTVADLAERTGRHYRSPHLRRDRRQFATLTWIVAATLAAALLLSAGWLLLR